jgi:hypothetical protein
MVDFMLNNLGAETFKGFHPHLKLLRLITDLDLLESLCFPRAAQ